MKTGQRPVWTLVTAALLALGCQSAWSAEITSRALQAERLLEQGQSEAALGKLDGAIDAFWTAAPLSFRRALFAAPGSIKAYGRYQPREGIFQPRGTATIYIEPVGYGFTSAGDQNSIELLAGVEIRSPGGIVFAQAPDFGRLTWTGRARSRELHGDISFRLPDLKPGDYHLQVTLRDEATGKTATTILPFAIAE